MTSENQTRLFEDKQANKIAKLEARIARLEKQKENLKDRNERLKLRLAKKDEAYKKLEKKLAEEGKVTMTPVRKLYSLHPNLAEAFTHLCQEWNLKTMNMRNTTMAMFRIIEPDDNGVVEYTEQDVINYISILRKLGRPRYMQNPTLAEYYEPYDSLILFKHYKMIRKNLLQWLNPRQAKSEQLGFKTGFVELDGKILEPKKKTAVCSWNDLRKQKQGVAHVNDTVNIEEFKGDDLIRERERRRVKTTGIYDEKAVAERIRYQAERYFGKDTLMQQIVEETPIMEEDDDLDLNDFKEVK